MTPTATPAGQACQEPQPRPVYRHRATAVELWPTPDFDWPHRPWLGPVLLTDEPPRRNEDYPYGYDGFGRYLLHNGLDLIEPLGTAVLAAADGVVVVAQADDAEQFGWRCGWYGLLIIIEMDERWHDQPVYLLYGHLDAIQVAPGERVTAGQTIGALGVSGATIGAHLHFEVRVGENSFAATRNPSLWLAPSPGHGLIAGQLVDEAGRPWQGVLVTAVSQPDGAIWRKTWSYLVDPAPLANPDERLAENFVLPDLPAGDYQLVVSIGGVEQRQMVTVVEGEVAVAALVFSR
jgi:murein DD-endopeptidase MepM/ murein hydrolase activator NlpD